MKSPSSVLPLLIRCSVLAVLAATAPLAGAGQVFLVLPGGDLQAAIDGASAGDEIVVDGGVHAPIVIDKPLEIRAVPGTTPLLRPTELGEWVCTPLPFGGCDPNETKYADPPIRLAGPGAGTVVLSGLEVAGSVEHFFFSNFPSAIEGGGFAELHIVDCTVTAPASASATGSIGANHAVHVDIGEITVRDSAIHGGSPVYDQAWGANYLFDGGYGISTTGDVKLCNSFVIGGPGVPVSLQFSTTCSALTGGHGGVGVSTPGSVTHSGSWITGGNGSVVTPWNSPTCTKPDGPAFAAGSVSEDSSACSTTASTWTDEGSALAGVSGDPQLVSIGDLTAGSLNSLELSNAAPSALSGLFLAASSTPAPFFGGTLKAYPVLRLRLLVTSPIGGVSLPFVMPAGLAPGTELWLQWAITDAAAIEGVSLSNAIKGVTP